MSARRREAALPLALALGGAVLLWLPAFHFRIDRVSCDAWPPLGAGAGYALAYAAAVALLSMAWLRAMKLEWTLLGALVCGAVVHLVAIVAPPFTSNDPLFYAALGRSLARYHGDAVTPLSLVLPAGDRFLAQLPESWRGGTSAYGVGFNQLTRLIALVGGDDLTRTLRLYQVLNVGALVATAALAGRAFGARAAALVLFAPLAIVDGSVNPHNDALLALAAAAFALALSRGRTVAGLAALSASLAVKLSGVLLLLFDLLALGLRPLAKRLRASTVLFGGALVAAAGVLAVLLAARLWPELGAFTALFGDPNETHPHVSRSIEGLPRAYLIYIAHAPRPSWLIGLVFRGASAVWLLYCGFRAAQEPAALLRWAATTLFVYYLLLHAFLQGWYLLPLLPLLPMLPAFMLPAARLFIVCLTAYYALSFPLDCDTRPLVIGVKEFLEAALVVLPAAFTLLAAWRRQARASAGTSRPAA